MIRIGIGRYVTVSVPSDTDFDRYISVMEIHMLIGDTYRFRRYVSVCNGPIRLIRAVLRCARIKKIHASGYRYRYVTVVTPRNRDTATDTATMTATDI